VTRPRQRLTRLERAALIEAAEFVLAGEWPWERDDGVMFTAETLSAASEKLKRSEPPRPEPGKERRQRAG
jgi:hypothetical protein